MLLMRRKIKIETERLTLRTPIHSDFRAWTALRVKSQSYLVPWEPTWADDHLTRNAITLDNIRRGPSQSATLGYWTGEPFARQGYMREAIDAVVHQAFSRLDLSRVEAACLPENAASRGLLEKAGFKYEGVAQSYLQIEGRWRTHVLYASLRSDRRGKTEAG